MSRACNTQSAKTKRDLAKPVLIYYLCDLWNHTLKIPEAKGRDRTHSYLWPTNFFLFQPSFQDISSLTSHCVLIWIFWDDHLIYHQCISSWVSLGHVQWLVRLPCQWRASQGEYSNMMQYDHLGNFCMCKRRPLSCLILQLQCTLPSIHFTIRYKD